MKKPKNFIEIQKEPSEFCALNLTIRHIIGEYPNNVNKHRYGRSKHTYCKICKHNSQKILEDNTHHNLWECDAALLSSTCRKLKQLIFDFICTKSIITIRELNEDTTQRTNSGLTQVLLNLNSKNVNERFKNFKSNLSSQENCDFQLLAQRYIECCDLVRNQIHQIIKDGRGRSHPRTLKTKTRHLRLSAKGTGSCKTAGKNKNTVLATKTRLLTLKSNISPLMESKTKLNIPIFFLVKSSYIFW